MHDAPCAELFYTEHAQYTTQFDNMHNAPCAELLYTERACMHNIQHGLVMCTVHHARRVVLHGACARAQPQAAAAPLLCTDARSRLPARLCLPALSQPRRYDLCPRYTPSSPSIIGTLPQPMWSLGSHVIVVRQLVIDSYVWPLYVGVVCETPL